MCVCVCVCVCVRACVRACVCVCECSLTVLSNDFIQEPHRAMGSGTTGLRGCSLEKKIRFSANSAFLGLFYCFFMNWADHGHTGRTMCDAPVIIHDWFARV